MSPELLRTEFLDVTDRPGARQSRKGDAVAGRTLPELRNSKVVTLSDLIDDAREFVAHHKDNRNYKSKAEIVREDLGPRHAAEVTPQELER